MKGMNRSSQRPIDSIIHNRIVLYVIVIASLINMTAYGLLGDIMTPLIFILVGTITAYYNKNMIVILVVALAFSNILKYGSQITMNMEGFTEGLENTSEGKDGDGETVDISNASTGLNKSGVKKNNKPSKETKTDENTPTMTTEEEEESLREFTEMKNKVIEIVDAVEQNMEKINKKMNEIQNKISVKEKDTYGSASKPSITPSSNQKNTFTNPFTNK